MNANESDEPTNNPDEERQRQPQRQYNSPSSKHGHFPKYTKPKIGPLFQCAVPKYVPPSSDNNNNNNNNNDQDKEEEESSNSGESQTASSSVRGGGRGGGGRGRARGGRGRGRGGGRGGRGRGSSALTGWQDGERTCSFDIYTSLIRLFYRR